MVDVRRQLPRWMKPHLKHAERPYLIEREIEALRQSHPVTSVLKSDKFKDHLESVLQSHVDGTRRNRVIRILQKKIVPVSEMEHAHQSFSESLLSGGNIVTYPFIKPVNDLRGSLSEKYSISERHARCKLASLYRLIDRLGWSQVIFNHISLRAPGKHEHFLLNAFGLHYSEVTASNLVKVDIDGNIIDPGTTSLGISKAGYIIHSAIHVARKDLCCIIHVHTPAGAAVSSMKCGLLPLSQESLTCGRVSYHNYRGIAIDEDEKKELVSDLGNNNKAMILHNHGLLAMGNTIEEAFAVCFNLVRACETQVMAMSVGLENLFLVEDRIAKKVMRIARQSGGGVSRHGNFGNGELEFEALMRVLDNLGYETGYPYKAEKLLSVDLYHDMKDVKSEENKGEIDALVSKIRQEIKRIKQEKLKNSSQSPVRDIISNPSIKNNVHTILQSAPTTASIATVTEPYKYIPTTTSGTSNVPLVFNKSLPPTTQQFLKLSSNAGMSPSVFGNGLGMSPIMSGNTGMSLTPTIQTNPSTGNWSFLDNRIAATNTITTKPHSNVMPLQSTKEEIDTPNLSYQNTPHSLQTTTQLKQQTPRKAFEHNANFQLSSTSSSSSATLSPPKLRKSKPLSGEPDQNKVAYHKQQIQSIYQQKYSEGNKKISTGRKDILQLTSSSSSSLELPSTVASKNVQAPGGGNIVNGLAGLDKLIHTAEQVAQSTGESLDKLSRSLSQQKNDYNVVLL